VGYPSAMLAALRQAGAAFAGVSNVALQAPLRPGMMVSIWDAARGWTRENERKSQNVL
jgi:hypothetical protein